MDAQRVVLLGHSLLIDGVAVSLAGRTGVCMVRIDTDEDKFERHILSLKPVLVIFELYTFRTEQLVALLNDHPGMQLVGIHPEHSHLVVLSGRQYRSATMQDLVAMLENAHPQTAVASDRVQDNDV